MKIYRSSGAPIEPDHKELYFKALNRGMDDLEEEMGKCTTENSEEYQDKMEVLHRKLTVDYPNKSKIPFMNTTKALRKSLEKYGTLAFCIEEGEIVAYIMDQ